MAFIILNKIHCNSDDCAEAIRLLQEHNIDIVVIEYNDFFLYEKDLERAVEVLAENGFMLDGIYPDP